MSPFIIDRVVILMWYCEANVQSFLEDVTDCIFYFISLFLLCCALLKNSKGGAEGLKGFKIAQAFNICKPTIQSKEK